MTFVLAKILQSKREFRQRLAARPIEEKLAMLDALRARSIALRGSRAESQPRMRYAKGQARRLDLALETVVQCITLEQ